MNYMKELLNASYRSVLTVPFKYFSTSGFGKFVHLPDNSVFLLQLPEGNAEVKYVKENGTLNLHHTFVPDKYKGQGIGQIIAKNVFEYCLERNLKVKLTCDFLIKFSESHQEFNKIIVSQD